MKEFYLEHGDMLKWNNGKWSMFYLNNFNRDILLTKVDGEWETSLWQDNSWEGLPQRAIPPYTGIRHKTWELEEVWRFTDKPTLVWKRRELNEVEKAVINFAKAIKYPYIAKDYDGGIYIYERKPYKESGAGYWKATSEEMIDLPHSTIMEQINFVSWDDDEPYDVRSEG